MFTRLLSSALAPYVFYGAVTAAVAAAGWGGYLNWQLDKSRAETVEVRNAWQLDKAQATAAALIETERIRAQEQHTAATQRENADEAQRLSTRARADAVGAGAADDRLRIAARAVAAGCRPAAGDTAAPGFGPADRLSDVLGECTARYRAVAFATDRAIIAGQWCSTDYEALIAARIVSAHSRE